mmetsp:Transcript_62384/g.142859  ORF Transcript_62384/g.142859 Transcript_62384/m.142859 type:complete len:258 (+) Transcript_62384:434-1207(+)
MCIPRRPEPPPHAVQPHHPVADERRNAKISSSHQPRPILAEQRTQPADQPVHSLRVRGLRERLEDLDSGGKDVGDDGDVDILLHPAQQHRVVAQQRRERHLDHLVGLRPPSVPIHGRDRPDVEHQHRRCGLVLESVTHGALGHHDRHLRSLGLTRAGGSHEDLEDDILLVRRHQALGGGAALLGIRHAVRAHRGRAPLGSHQGVGEEGARDVESREDLVGRPVQHLVREERQILVGRQLGGGPGNRHKSLDARQLVV